MKLCDSSSCVGCCACLNICSQKAIQMTKNKFGELLPSIDMKKCIECGACRKVCPVINDTEKSSPLAAYAAWSKDAETVRNSASSGIVTELSGEIISAGGVVFGTRYEGNTLIFDYADNQEKIELFKGSKYVHAYIGNAYQSVKKFLKTGVKVLFVGTPCQIAGLKCFLNKNYPNLYTVDLICHGVAPNAYLQEYMRDKLGKKTYDSVIFRGAEGEKTVAYNQDRIIYLKKKTADYFYYAYAKGLIHRENCYSCPYSSQERVGDITAGDFWGIDKNKLNINASEIPYVSLVLVNNLKGKDLFKMAQKRLIFEERPFSEALSANKQLTAPCQKNDERDMFLKIYSKTGFIKAMKSTELYRVVRKNDIHYKCFDMLSRIKKLLIKK